MEDTSNVVIANTKEFNNYLLNLKNTPTDTKLLISNMKNNELNIKELTEHIFKILIKEPVISKKAYYYEDTPYSQYVINNNAYNNTMGTLLRYKQIAPVIVEAILDLYNEDYCSTREVIHYINSLQGDDKVPYLMLYLEHILKYLNINSKLNLGLLKVLFKNDMIIRITQELKEKYGYIKFVGGETNITRYGYGGIFNYINVDFDSIQEAEIGLDLGGGYATTILSKLFRKELTCVDVNNPNRIEDLKNFQDYSGELDKYGKLPYINFLELNVLYDSLPDNYNSYFIPSFGFINSTIGPRTYMLEECSEVTNLLVCYAACYRIAELITKGKEVYCIFWGRPTVRVNENKIVSLKFKNNKLLNSDILSDPLSTKHCHDGRFGSELDFEFIKRPDNSKGILNVVQR